MAGANPVMARAVRASSVGFNKCWRMNFPGSCIKDHARSGCRKRQLPHAAYACRCQPTPPAPQAPHGAAVPLSFMTWRSLNVVQVRPAVPALTALLSHPEHGACWVADNDGILCGYLIAVFLLSI